MKKLCLSLLWAIATIAYAGPYDDMNASIKRDYPDVIHKHKNVSVQFKIFDGQISPKPHRKTYDWQRFFGRLPKNAVVGGHEMNRVLYMCQSRYQNGIQPGKVVDNRCNITYAGKEIEQLYFRVLTGHGFRWVWGSDGYMPPRAVAGGYENGHPLMLCRARFGRGIHPGKIVAGVCNIGYGGKEYRIPGYQVLVKIK